MHLHETVKPVTSADAAIIREVFPRHPVKRLARLLGLSLSTAHQWTYRQLSSARRRELALALLGELDRQDVARTALRRRLAEWAAEEGMDVAMGGITAGMDRAKAGTEEGRPEMKPPPN